MHSDQPNSLATLIVLGFFPSLAVTNVATVIFTGLFTDDVRYILPLLVLPAVWGFPLLFAHLTPVNPSIRVAAAVCLTAAGALGQFAQNGNRLSQLYRAADYYPGELACLDTRTAELGLQRGIATYWQARPFTLLSQSGLKIAQVASDLSPYHWVNNLESFNLEPQFVLIDLRFSETEVWRLDERMIRRRFGEPTTEFACERSKVLVYNRSSDFAFRNMFNGHPALARIEKPGDSYTFLALNLPSSGSSVSGTSRVLREGVAGYVTHGPYSILPAGAYAFEVLYAATSARPKVGNWDITIAKPDRADVLLKGDLPSNDTAVRGEFELSSADRIEVRVFFDGGEGSLAVHSLQIIKKR